MRKIYGGFGKSSVEIVSTNQQAYGGDADANGNQPEVLLLKALFHQLN
jgi:hypothetical protein